MSRIKLMRSNYIFKFIMHFFLPLNNYHEFSMLIVLFYSLISDGDDVFDHGKLPVKSSDTELEKLKINYYGLKKGLVSLPLKVPGTTFNKRLHVNIKK